MEENALKALFKKKNLRISFLIFSALLLSVNELSCKHWNRKYFGVWKINNSLDIIFKVYDSNFGSPGVHAFLSDFECEYSFDNQNYKHLMSASTGYEMRIGNKTWLNMRDKLRGAKIYFHYCKNPPAGTLWAEDQNYRLELFNWAGGKNVRVCLKWDLQQEYKNVKSLRISGTWAVNGQENNELIDKEVYPIENVYLRSKIPVSIDSLQNQVDTPVVELPGNNETRVCGVAGAIVVKGAERGQNIKVYTTSGALIKSIIATNDIEKIKLAANQIYIVNIEQNRHRVAL